ncbi:MAG: AAA family ATPase [Firmicutes bacterium]|nr:AAA family ATPase [Bacillota bacterium]
MRIDKLLLRNFRNYKQLELTLDPYLNIFVGANAQGKTNLLESLIFVASGHSFRTKSEEELVRFGEKESNVEAHIEHRQGRERLRVNYHLQNKKKNYFSNGVELIRSDFVGRLIPVLFTPEDLAVVKGSPQVRRNGV